MFELIITIAIVAILAGLAFPSYREFSVRMTVNDNTNDLVGALNLARAEAVKRGRTVSLFANGGDWDAGYQVVAGKSKADGSVDDPVSPGATEATCAAYLDLDDETPLCPRFQEALPATYALLGKAVGSGASDTEVRFGPTGALAGGADSFDFSVCRPAADADAAQSRLVRVAASGAVSSQRSTANSAAGDCP